MLYGWNHNTISRADGVSCASHPPCGWLCWLVPVSRADGITTPSPMRLAGNHDRLSFLIPVIKIDCVCSMSMVGYVAMSSVVRMVAAAQAIPHAVMSSCCTDGIITDYNTVMYAVLFARVRLLPVCPSAGWLSKLQVSYRQICK